MSFGSDESVGACICIHTDAAYILGAQWPIRQEEIYYRLMRRLYDPVIDKWNIPCWQVQGTESKMGRDVRLKAKSKEEK